jgi:hypothetical protein
MKLTARILFILLILGLQKTYGQIDTIKDGAYRNIVEFKKNKPKYISDFTFYQKYGFDTNNNSDVYLKSDNKIPPKLYGIKSKNPKIKNRIIKKYIWGIYKDKSFYLNVNKLGMTDGYIKIDTLYRYTYFTGLPIMSLKQEHRLNKAAFEFGLIGIGITYAIISNENKNNIHYILNIDTGMIHLFTKNYLMWILESYPELLLEYQNEDKNETLKVMKKYLDLINQKTK